MKIILEYLIFVVKTIFFFYQMILQIIGLTLKFFNYTCWRIFFKNRVTIEEVFKTHLAGTVLEYLYHLGLVHFLFIIVIKSIVN